MAVMNNVTEVLHKINAKLYPNHLGRGGGAWVARSRAEAPLSTEDICASAKNRGGFTGQYKDLVEHAHIFLDELVYQLLDGFSVQAGNYFSLHTRIGGTYSGARDPIDASKITVSFRQLRQLRELLEKVKVENGGPAGDGACIDQIADTRTETVNSGITPGGMVHITGNKIQVVGQGAETGVWFVSTGDGTRTRVDENLGLNRPNEVMAQVPVLPPGQYRLEIVTRYAHGNILLKEPRTITAAPELTVA